jgi:hypothetical protein
VTLSFLGKQITPNSIEGKEIKWRKDKFDKVLNTIAYQVNRSERFSYCPIKQGHYGNRKRKL